MINIAIFVSGSGTNCENLIKYFADSERVNCALVLSNKPDAFALTRAQRLGVETAVAPKPQLPRCCPSSVARACGAITSTKPSRLPVKQKRA